MAAIAPFVLGVAAFFFYIFFKYVLKQNASEADVSTEKQEKSLIDSTQSEAKETGSEKQTLEDYGNEKVADVLRTAMSELSSKSVKEKPKEEVQVEEVKDTMSQTVKEQDMNKDVGTAPTESVNKVEPKQEEIKKSEEILDSAKTPEVLTEKSKIVSATPVESCEKLIVKEAVETDSKEPNKEVASQEAVRSNVHEIPVTQTISQPVSGKDADQVHPAESLVGVPISETKPEPPTKEITEVLEKRPEKEVPSSEKTDKLPTPEVLNKCSVTGKTPGEVEEVLTEKIEPITEPDQIPMDKNVALPEPSEKTSDEVSKILVDEGVLLKESNQTLLTEGITELPASGKTPVEVQGPTAKSSVPTEEHSQAAFDKVDLIPVSQESHKNVQCTDESSTTKATDLPAAKTADDTTNKCEEVPVSKVIVDESSQAMTAGMNASESVQKSLVSGQESSVPPAVEEVKPQTVGLETLSKEVSSVKDTDTQLLCSDVTTQKSIDSSSKETSESAVTQEPKKELQEPKSSNEGSSPDLGSFIVTDTQLSTTSDPSVIVEQKTSVETCQESTDKQTEAVEKTGGTEKKSTSSREGEIAGNEKVEQLSSKAEKVLSMIIQQPDDGGEGKAAETSSKKESTLEESIQQKVQKVEGKDEEIKSEVIQTTEEEMSLPKNKIEEKQCGQVETSEL
ncbi:uncharacterized protein LOC143241776 isoform X2 [Tachypleus tridentatus]|uniref:uncharacterized protein LOC143241776 isoform X2 n=2 Tax=Tachypleus tridentatus TaxID=6853 RepID=UPI003FCFAC3E